MDPGTAQTYSMPPGLKTEETAVIAFGSGAFASLTGLDKVMTS